jgi:hypothetical protein
MKQLKSRVSDLRSLFEKNITIAYVAEPLKTFPATTETTIALAWMEERDFDVIGIEHEGETTGYVERPSLLGQGGCCGDYEQPFLLFELVAISTPLLKILPLFQQKSRLFVLENHQVNGIITQGDLQKAPVRMLLFSLVTLLEMNLLRLIRHHYEDHHWQQILKTERLNLARKYWQESQARNEATDLLDYLQFCDKRDLVLAHPQLLQKLGLPSKRHSDRLLKEAEQLRNRLAHAQDLVSGSSWQELISLAGAIEQVLICCEESFYSAEKTY